MKLGKFLTGQEIEYVRQVGLDFFGLPTADKTHTAEVAVFGREGKMHGTYNVMEALEYAKCVRKVEALLSDEDGKPSESESIGSES